MAKPKETFKSSKKDTVKPYKIKSAQKDEAIRLITDLLNIAIYIGNELLECMYRISLGESVYIESIDNTQVKKKLRHLFKTLDISLIEGKRYSLKVSNESFFTVFRKLLNMASKNINVSWAELRAAEIPVEEKPPEKPETLQDLYNKTYSKVDSKKPISFLPNSSDLWGLSAQEQRVREKKNERKESDPWTKFDREKDLAVAPKSLPAGLIRSMYGEDSKLDSRFKASKRMKGPALHPPRPPSSS